MDTVVLPFPSPIPATTKIRSTLLLGGVASLRDGGFAEAYAAVSPPEVQAAVDSAVAAMWLPIELAVAHYLACDELGLSNDTVAQLGRGTFERTKGLLLGAATGIARGAGVTPWTLMPHLNRFWLRGFDGGGVRATKRAPKEVDVDIVECPLMRSRYYRAALRGLFTVLLELVCAKAYVHERASGTGSSDTGIALRAQWV
jgi:hypothetical protein